MNPVCRLVDYSDTPRAGKCLPRKWGLAAQSFGETNPAHRFGETNREAPVKLLQYAAATPSSVKWGQGPIAHPGVRLARVVTLSYHSVAIMDGDQKANRGDKKLMAGRHRKLKNIVCRGGQVGREFGE